MSKSVSTPVGPIDPVAALAGLCRSDYYAFVQETWHLAVPAPPVWAPHMRAICGELQELGGRIVARRKKKHDLVINVPPGTSKSTLCSVLFPAWLMACDPTVRFCGASYSYHLALELSRKCRAVMEAKFYRRLFPGSALSREQNTKGYFMTRRGGLRYAVGAGGSVLGFHFDCIVADDPLDPEMAASKIELAANNRFIVETLSTRMTDKSVTPMVVVMQRLHEEDTTARMLERPPVRHVRLPAEDDGSVLPPEWAALYRDGLLDPERLGRQVLSKEKAKGTRFYAAQMMQRPAPEGGALFEVGKVKEGVPPAEFAALCRFWDRASGHETGDYTAGVLGGRDKEGNFWVLDVVEFRLEPGARNRRMLEVAEADGPEVPVGVEQEPNNSGKEAALAIARVLGAFKVKLVPVGRKRRDDGGGNKEVRADPFAAAVNNGVVWVPKGAPWVRRYLDQLSVFPFGKHDDLVDASAGCYNMCAPEPPRAGAI